MHRRQSALHPLLAIVALAAWSAAPSAAATAPPDMEAALIRAAGTECNPPAGCAVSGFQRAEIVPGIVHYSAIVHVGPGAHDRIGIHRVVKEIRAGYPVKVPHRVMLLHGDWKDFVGCFLPALYASSTPAEFGFAIFLARNNVDVWGIDQGWTLVPAGTADFGFMAGWGMQRQIDDLRTALAISRATRGLMGAGSDRFDLLGYSSGGATGYALLDHEARLPRAERHVMGYIAADMALKSGDPAYRDAWCGYQDFYQQLYDQGIYQEDVPLPPMGTLARSDPDGPSPVFPGFTNLQAALFMGAGPLFGATPIHYLAGVFDADGIPTGLQYVSVDAWLDFMVSGVPYEAILFELEYMKLLCDRDESPFDDHLADVKVPVYNWAAAGGIGPYGVDTLPLLGSRDVSSLIVSLHPPEEVLLDFAHIDLFLSEDSIGLAWEPLLEWLKSHP